MSNEKMRAALDARQNGRPVTNGQPGHQNGHQRGQYVNRSQAYRPPEPDPIPELDDREPTGKVPHQVVLLEGGAKSGKAQPLHSRIVTPHGWTTMGELTVGDAVIGADGRATTVTGVHERGERPIYRLTFSDGATVEACDEHLWATWTGSALHRTYNKGPKRGQRNHRPAAIRTTLQVRELVLAGTRVHIPVADPVQYAPAAPLPVDPYVLGLLLGDGGLTTGYPSFTTGDPELGDALIAALPDHVTRRSASSKPDHIHVYGVRTGPAVRALRDLGVLPSTSATKHIPDVYLTACPADRLALLQGLMDTDGGMEWKSITFTTVSPRLAEQVRELVWSLGGTCGVTTKHPTYTNAAGERAQGKTAYRLTLRLPLGVCPFRLARKVQTWQERRPTKNMPPRRTVRQVDYVGRMPARCITVAAADHLYLTDAFTVTHNSFEMAKLSGSDKVGRSWWLDLGEGTGDQYGRGKVHGSRYRMLNHDGTMRSIIGQVRAVAEQARLDFEAGKPPVCLFIDSATIIWEGLKRRAHARAKRTYTNRAKLDANPDAEITVAHNFWNDANRDWRDLMTILLTFKGIVVLSARGKEVTKFEDGKPVEDGEKDYRVQGQRDLAFDASVWVRLSRDEKPMIVGARSLTAGVKPGKLGDPPQAVRNGVFSLEWLLFTVLGYDPQDTEARDLVDPDSEDAGQSTAPRPSAGERITVDPDSDTSPFDSLDEDAAGDGEADAAEADAVAFAEFVDAARRARDNSHTTRADVEALWREGVEARWMNRQADPADPQSTPRVVLTQAAHAVKGREQRTPAAAGQVER